jgi:hypothetical protein
MRCLSNHAQAAQSARDDARRGAEEASEKEEAMRYCQACHATTLGYGGICGSCGSAGSSTPTTAPSFDVLCSELCSELRAEVGLTRERMDEYNNPAEPLSELVPRLVDRLRHYETNDPDELARKYADVLDQVCALQAEADYMEPCRALKPVKAWAIVTASGKVDEVAQCRRFLSDVKRPSERIIRVEIRELPRRVVRAKRTARER